MYQIHDNITHSYYFSNKCFENNSYSKILLLFIIQWFVIIVASTLNMQIIKKQLLLLNERPFFKLKTVVQFHIDILQSTKNQSLLCTFLLRDLKSKEDSPLGQRKRSLQRTQSVPVPSIEDSTSQPKSKYHLKLVLISQISSSKKLLALY